MRDGRALAWTGGLAVRMVTTTGHQMGTRTGENQVRYLTVFLHFADE